MDEEKNTKSGHVNKPKKQVSIPLTFILPIVIILLIVAGGGVYFGIKNSKTDKSLNATSIKDNPEISQDVTTSPKNDEENTTDKPLPTTKADNIVVTSIITATPAPTSANTPTPTNSFKIVPKLSLKLIATPAPKPDLVIKEYSFIDPDKTGFYYPKLNDSFKVKIWIYNQGEAKAEGFLWEWWASDTKMVCQEWITNLGANGGQVVECNYKYTIDGNFQTKAVIDSKNQVNESNENNNTQTQVINPV
jgi:hypothetical protein